MTAAYNDEKRKSPMYQVHEANSGNDTIPEKQGVVKTARDIFTINRSNQHLYLTGLRGILVVESFLWTFFEAFIPTLVSELTPGPEYQSFLRRILSVPLWNANLIHNFFIILSMRTICISFLENPTGQVYAATVIRRIVRMAMIMFLGSGMATLIFTQIGTGYIDDFKFKLPNETIKTPEKAYDAVAASNSLFNLFWITDDFYTQAANTFWPNATLWVSSIIYFQVSRKSKPC